MQLVNGRHCSSIKDLTNAEMSHTHTTVQFIVRVVLIELALAVTFDCGTSCF